MENVRKKPNDAIDLSNIFLYFNLIYQIMKKAIIEIELLGKYKEIANLHLLFEKVESWELIELIKIDFEKGVKIALTKVTMKEGFTIQDLKFPKDSKILSIIQQKDNQYICIIKGNPPFQDFPKLKSTAKKFDLNIIWATPSIMTHKSVTMNVIGDNENLKKFLEAIKNIGNIKKLSFQKASFEWKDLLSCLTEKQKKIIITAKKNGYYNYPRNINTESLSKRVGISKSTTVEHLRKAESRIINNLLAGY